MMEFNWIMDSITRVVSTDCAFIDLTKAFDQINFDVLVFKLQKTQIPPL